MPSNVKPLIDTQLLEILALSKDATAIFANEQLEIAFVNDAMLAFWDKSREIVGSNLVDVMPELIEQGFIGILTDVWQSGITYRAEDKAAELYVKGKLQTRYFDFVYRALKNEEGKTYAILHTATEVTDRVAALELVKDKDKTEKKLLKQLFAANEEHRATSEEVNFANEYAKSTNNRLILANEELVASRKQATNAEQFLSQAIEAANIGTWNLNAQTRKLVTSLRLKELFGFSATDNPSLNDCIAQISPEYQPFLTEQIDKALTQGGDYDLSYSVVGLHDQKIRWVRAVGHLSADSHGEIETFAGVVIDITDQKQDEQLKNDFISMVSHELKTPLTSLMAYIQMLQIVLKTATDGRVLDMLKRSRSQVTRMNKIITGFLDVSRFDGGKLYIEASNFSLKQLIIEIIDDVALTSSTHKIIFEAAEDVIVTADRDKIGQVVQNLLSNALKYSPHGKNIEISYLVQGNMVTLSLRDYGMGVKAEDLDKLFNRFYRIRNNQTETIAGFGIGLYLCSEIIKRHKGEIWIESDGQIGSVFRFSIPIDKP
ncbi:two-component system sensor histidine kinase VicK [Pedobacter sp. UYP30]|uniref:PAS domain-containing sensor histidine kinase n=1 Tax=Pedobacter sp. UYP30 TaxID=1756400 RepID=UPI00339A3C36